MVEDGFTDGRACHSQILLAQTALAGGCIIAIIMLAHIAAGGAGIVCIPASVGAAFTANVTDVGTAGVSMGAGIGAPNAGIEYRVTS